MSEDTFLGREGAEPSGHPCRPPRPETQSGTQPSEQGGPPGTIPSLVLRLSLLIESSVGGCGGAWAGFPSAQGDP